MYEKRISLVVLLDMFKAFDSIQHDNLLLKLHSVGVSTPLYPCLRVTYHYTSKLSGLAVSFPIPSQGQWVWPIHFRSSFVHLVCQRASLSTEEVRRAMGYVDKLLLAHLSPSDISVAISDLNQQWPLRSREVVFNKLSVNQPNKLLVVGVPDHN